MSICYSERQVIADSPEQEEARQFSKLEMQTKLKDEKILKHLMPDNFAVGCRMLTPGNGYLEALTEDNVRVVVDSIQNVQANGILLKNGELLEVDTIICATGFDLSFCPRFDLIGRDGIAIHEK